MPQYAPSDHPLYKWQEALWLLIAILTPLFVNLWVEQQFEASKVWLLRTLIWLLGWLSHLVAMLQRFTMSSGGHSSSTNFSVNAVIGQPATDVLVGTDYAVSAGFLQPEGLNQKVWLPLVLR